MPELLTLPIKQIHEKLVQKEVSAREIAEHSLENIKEQEGEINAFITCTPELALACAEAVDKKIATGDHISVLAGIPCGLKDSILLQGVRCTAASKILEHYIAPYDATVSARLRAHDVCFVGKTNTDEFGMGGSTENSAFGVTKNPHDSARVAGGSSGGSAACIAANESSVALGEDTGGSIRLPSSFCGVVGLKPTYGAVSRHGVIGIASSLDQVGPMGKNAEDTEILFEAIVGQDEYDATSVSYAYKPLEGEIEMKKLRIGMPKEYFADGINPGVEKVIRAAIKRFEDAGAHIEEISLPHTKYALATYYVINTSEISSNLARYDGIRYGESAEAQDLLETYLQTKGQYLGPEVKRRIMLGTYALSAGYYDAYYKRAQQIRTLLKEDFDHAFEKVDVVMGPVSPSLPFAIGEKTEDPLAMYLVDVYSVPVNLVGLPGLSLPAGQAKNLPVGLQVIAKPFQENLLFGIAKAFEKIS